MEKEIVTQKHFDNPNIEKIGNLADNLSNYLEEGKKTTKATKYYMLGFIGIFLFLMLGGIIAVAFNSGGVGTFINNMWGGAEINYRIKCFNEQNQSMIFRLPSDAKDFMELFPNSKCDVIDVRTKTEEN